MSAPIADSMTVADAILYAEVVSRLYHSNVLLGGADRCLMVEDLSQIHRIRLKAPRVSLLNYINRDSNVRDDILDRYGLMDLV